MKTLWGREPVAFIGVLNAGIALAVGFGVKLTPAQVGLVNAFATAVLALIARSQVTPVTKDEQSVDLAKVGQL